MNSLKSVLVIAAAIFGIATSAHGGTSNAYTFSPSASAPVSALQDNVSYFEPAVGKLPANETQVGFIVGDPTTGLLLQQASGNTLNRVTITFEASVTDINELLTFHQPDVYLANLPSECTWNDIAANPKKIVCTYRKTTPGFTFPSFIVFFNAPAKVIGGLGDADGSDKIRTQVRVLYAEGVNGADPSIVNSTQDSDIQELVTLGTVDPIDVRTAVAKSGTKIHTGDGGIPKNETDKQHAELVTVPGLPGLYTVAKIKIEKKVAGQLGGENCLTAGNFLECPEFTTTIADPNTNIETRFLPPSNPLTIIYRTDAANLKRPAAQILGGVLLTYTGKKYDPDTHQEIGSWTDQVVPGSCVNDQPRLDGLPCVLGKQCFKNLKSADGIADLVADCEWRTINTGNGFIKIQ